MPNSLTASQLTKYQITVGITRVISAIALVLAINYAFYGGIFILLRTAYEWL